MRYNEESTLRKRDKSSPGPWGKETFNCLMGLYFSAKIILVGGCGLDGQVRGIMGTGMPASFSEAFQCRPYFPKDPGGAGPAVTSGGPERFFYISGIEEPAQPCLRPVVGAFLDVEAQG